MKIKPIKFSLLSILLFIYVLNPTSIGSPSNIQNSQIPITSPYSITPLELFPHEGVEPQQECNVHIETLQRGADKDSIKSIDNPIFVDPSHETAPNDPRQKIIGIAVDGVARAYPYNILNWHEIVNDEINGNKVSITYCPLTGSGIPYATEVLNNTELGTSGLLYENNLVFYERDTNTHWSQMGEFAIKGSSLGRNLESIETTETTLEAWLKMHPESKVLSTDVGKGHSLSIDYERYPYGSYRSDGSIYFPTTYDIQIAPYNLYHEKELTHIIQFDDETLLLPFEELEKIPILNHNFVNQDLFTVFLESEDLALTYFANVNGTKLNFTLYEGPSNVFSSDLTLDLPLFVDNFENIWNFNGLAISGELMGTQLRAVPTYNAFWFAAISFYYDASILIIKDTEIIETQISDGTTIESTKTIPSIIETSFSVDPKVQDPGSLPFSSYYVFAIITLTMIRYKRRKI